MANRVNTLKYNWNQKHREYMKQSQVSAYNIAEGSIRSGKTTDNVFCFAHDIKRSKDKIHLATASTQPTAKLIIGDCDGYGLEHIFRGQCRWGKYRGNECLIIKGPDTGYKEKVVLFCGGAKADSYKKFRGMSIGLWIATEINLHHDETIKEALKRQINADIKRLYWDLNPENPNAFIYRDYIDRWQEMANNCSLLGGYNYRAFNIFDNINISERNIQEVLSRYEPGTVDYIRDIEGKRCAAEGIIYRQFANNPDKYIIDTETMTAQERQTFMHELDFISIGIDFGGNRSLTTFVATAVYKRFDKITVIKDHAIKGRKGEIDSDVVNREFIRFAREIMSDFSGVQIRYVFGDSEAQYLINGLFKAIRNAGLPFTVGDCLKAQISQRITCANTLFNLGRLQINKCCKIVIDGLKNAVWDPKASEQGKDIRLDDFTSDIDILDAFEYSWERFMRKLLPEGVRKVESDNIRGD